MNKNQFKRQSLGVAPTGGEAILYTDSEEALVIQDLEKRTDFEAMRLKRLLALPDLTCKIGSPVKFVLDKILTLPILETFDVLKIPETISVENNFDLFDFPAEHPARRETDTYFLSANRILRTHTTSMWLYYLTDPENLKKLKERGWVGLLAYGKVYRKEIGRAHV